MFLKKQQWCHFLETWSGLVTSYLWGLLDQGGRHALLLQVVSHGGQHPDCHLQKNLHLILLSTDRCLQWGWHEAGLVRWRTPRWGCAPSSPSSRWPCRSWGCEPPRPSSCEPWCSWGSEPPCWGSSSCWNQSGSRATWVCVVLLVRQKFKYEIKLMCTCRKDHFRCDSTESWDNPVWWESRSIVKVCSKIRFGHYHHSSHATMLKIAKNLNYAKKVKEVQGQRLSGPPVVCLQMFART